MASCCGGSSLLIDAQRYSELGRRSVASPNHHAARGERGRFVPNGKSRTPARAEPARTVGRDSGGCDEGKADAVVSLAARRFWPHVKVEELAAAAGVSIECLRLAVERRKASVPRPRPSAAVEPENRRRRIRGPGDPPSQDHVWCTFDEGHWVHIDEMARNVARPGGLADWCRPCFDVYRKRRYRRGSITSPAARRPL